LGLGEGLGVGEEVGGGGDLELGGEGADRLEEVVGEQAAFAADGDVGAASGAG
jgi:hypothetical protein